MFGVLGFLPYTLNPRGSKCLLGGSWVAISRVISRITMVITYIRGLIPPLITTHEPPSKHSLSVYGGWFFADG